MHSLACNEREHSGKTESFPPKSDFFNLTPHSLSLMQPEKKAILALVLIVGFLLLGFSLPTLINASIQAHSIECVVDEQCIHEEQLNSLSLWLPLTFGIALLLGALVYYFLTPQKSMEASQASTLEIEKLRQAAVESKQAFLKLLNPDERKVVEKILDGNGKALQAEVSRLPGMTKVKSHRVLQKLMDRNVIEKDKLGKTNIIQFTPEIKAGLL